MKGPMKQALLEMFGTTSNDLSPQAILARLAAASIIAGFIFLSYRLSHEGSIYSKKFNVSLVMLTVITTTVMIVIGNNLAMSLGMVGALSIVRFRTAVKDTRDTVYIFWTIVVGICCGAGDYVTAGSGSAFVFVLMLLFGRNRMLLIIRAARMSEEQIEAVVFRYFSRKAILRVKNTTENSVEFIYELSRKLLEKKKGAGKQITDEIYAVSGIEYVNIVMQNDEIGS